MTWKEIKLATLQKMFSAEGTSIQEDEVTRDYLNAMPQAANEGALLLSTSNKMLRKSLEIEQKGDPQAAGSIRYDLSSLTDDFYRFGDLEVYRIEDDTMEELQNCSEAAGHYVLIPASAGGKLEVYYDAWPPSFTLSTPDDYEIPLDPEVAVLLPLYMASQLYKDDDNGIATAYRNEFEVARSELRRRTAGMVPSTFYSVTGWC